VPGSGAVVRRRRQILPAVIGRRTDVWSPSIGATVPDVGWAIVVRYPRSRRPGRYRYRSDIWWPNALPRVRRVCRAAPGRGWPAYYRPPVPHPPGWRWLPGLGYRADRRADSRWIPARTPWYGR